MQSANISFEMLLKTITALLERQSEHQVAIGICSVNWRKTNGGYLYNSDVVRQCGCEDFSHNTMQNAPRLVTEEFGKHYSWEFVE